MSVQESVTSAARTAKQAARVLARSDGDRRNQALTAMAGAIRDRAEEIKQANAADMKAGAEKGLSAAMLDRLMLDDERIEKIARALEEIAALPDPVGRVLSSWTIPNGLNIEKVAMPIGVIGIIYESRPNVTADAAGLCMKSGNAALLRGGSEAINSNLAIAKALQGACEGVGLPAGCVSMIDITDHAAVQVMCRLPQYVDLIIPRGGEELIRAVSENSQVPVLKHYRGMTQIYVDAEADVELAVKLVHNAKVQRPGVCNAVENLYVHRDNLEALRAIVADLQAAGVEIRGCPRTCAAVPGCVPATAEDWDTEYLGLILSVMVVDSMDEALAQIAAHTSGLTEAIYTDNLENAERFLREVDSACVYHNASTRFTDGGEFGLGAEIGISTDKIHARGPMGVRELTSYKYLVRGEGQVRG